MGRLGYGDSDRGDEPNEMGQNLPFVDLGTGKTAKQISVGEYSTCAILNDDSLKCLGWNNVVNLVTVIRIVEATDQVRWGIICQWLIWELVKQQNK